MAQLVCNLTTTCHVASFGFSESIGFDPSQARTLNAYRTICLTWHRDDDARDSQYSIVPHQRTSRTSEFYNLRAMSRVILVNIMRALEGRAMADGEQPLGFPMG
jgi:hypothetical protein